MNNNPFKVGDKVKLLQSSYDFNPSLWRKYTGHKYATVLFVSGDKIITTIESDTSHYSHFELYKEPEEQTMQQPKTKRIPFTHELWEKHKDKDVVVTALNGRVLEQFTCFNLPDTCLYAGVYDGLVGNYYSSHLFLEIPITTKRIPFNPELKDAKVFYDDTELTEWVLMSSNVVCGVHTQVHPFKSLETALYHPTHLEMEIEEDAP
jgi:hypothetical protein